MCEELHCMCKPEIFDVLVSFLRDETEQWFYTEFTEHEKFRLKNVKNFTMKFKDRYCMVSQVPSKTGPSIQLLVDRIQKLEPLAEIGHKRDHIIKQQAKSISLLQSQVKSFGSMEKKL